MNTKYITEVHQKNGIRYQARVDQKKSRLFVQLVDAIRWRDYALENGEFIEVAAFNPIDDNYVRKIGNLWMMQLSLDGKIVYPFKSRLRSEVKEFRNHYFGMEETKCSKCGKTFWKKYPEDICNDCYESPLDKPECIDDEELKEFKWTPTHPELVEKEARKIGLHYADIQKQKTLALAGSIIT